MKAYERLLKYAVMRTPSDGKSAATPTTKQQFDPKMLPNVAL